MKLLIIEDEVELLDSIRAYFEKESYLCEQALTFSEAEEKINLYSYDCIFLDLNLPGGNGLQLIPTIKNQQKESGIIIISARDKIEDRVKGLELGADDYLTKPFHLSELNARFRSVIRRLKFDGDETIKINNIEILPGKREVKFQQFIFDFTPKEYNILLYLAINKNKVITKESLAEHLLGDFADTSDSFDFVYSHIKNVRKKITEKTGEDYIKNIYGVGYKLEVD
jgi:DNA-binding response OmpR family regulator